MVKKNTWAAHGVRAHEKKRKTWAWKKKKKNLGKSPFFFHLSFGRPCFGFPYFRQWNIKYWICVLKFYLNRKLVKDTNLKDDCNFKNKSIMEHMTQTTLVPIHANVVFSSTIESGNYNSYSITIKSLHETSEKKTQKNPYASFFFSRTCWRPIKNYK